MLSLSSNLRMLILEMLLFGNLTSRFIFGNVLNAGIEFLHGMTKI